MPYTIVLTPSIEQRTKYIEASQTLYSDFQPQYLLTKDGFSSPHITVVQFDCDSLDLAKKIWECMCAIMHEENWTPFVPPFTGISFIDGVGPYEGTTWVELSIQRGDEHSPIMTVHNAALKALKYHNIEPLNATGNNYRPHLTLARIVMPEQVKVWSKSLHDKTENFNLELGLSDDQWQYEETLEVFSEEFSK